MINFDYQPSTYFDGTGPSALLVKLTYPESQWGEEISIFANTVDGEILFEAVDFYGNDFKIVPEKYSQTLSLQALIIMIETMDVAPDLAQGNVEWTLAGIPEAESLLYPDLKAYFNEKRRSFGLS
ncbi:UDP-glucuronosyltransferase [Rhodonellum sp.]|uniref:UDP-glucuronosyltransferase n=1 Tax=Rhodonellum sp. TaxID=2231180 RepID=UPI002715D11C|nr:UDP-glucuronosyltransferase [Rhodonellum sp.]MDO9551568.1 UDP-glucuronosyltransferase [Rhodonellum sp.]